MLCLEDFFVIVKEISFSVNVVVLVFSAAPGKNRVEFEASISSLFSAITQMLKLSSNQVLPLQVRYFYETSLVEGDFVICSSYFN